MSVLPLLLALMLPGAAPANPGAGTPVIGPCDGCELALVGLPADPPATARLVAAGEAGEPMHLEGIVRDASGKPRAGIIVYAHQTDASGHYPPASPPHRHGRLRAWARTGADGRYAFLTVRPGSYPGSTAPQHIHLHVIEPGCALYYIDDVLFRDDPNLTPRTAREMDRGRGGHGITRPQRREGVWLVHRDIILGQRIPGYPDCAPQAAASRP